jgi:hypothetical protein
MNVQDMKERIEIMPKHYQIEIGKILISQYQITHNENQNGIFINLSNVSYEILEKLQTIYKHNIKDIDLKEVSINPWTQQAETTAEIILKNRKEELDRKHFWTRMELMDIEAELKTIDDYLKT